MTEMTKIAMRITWTDANAADTELFRDWIMNKSDSHIIASEHEDTNYHWHLVFVARFKNLASFRSALKHKFPWAKLGNEIYSLKEWKDDGAIRYLCKGVGPDTPPTIISHEYLGFDPLKSQKEYYAVGNSLRMSRGQPKEWMEPLVKKLREQGASFSTPAEAHKIFLELIKVCPGVTKHQLITYMLKIRRALDQDDYGNFMWNQISMDVC